MSLWCYSPPNPRERLALGVIIEYQGQLNLRPLEKSRLDYALIWRAFRFGPV